MSSELNEFKEEKIALAKQKIPELFSLAFSHKQKNLYLSFK
jgi:hypothetical protein